MRILGLDLGSTSVKAVELESAFRRYEIHEYHEQKIETGADPFQIAKNLVLSLPKAPDRIAVAMKTSQMTFRNLQLPTRDKRAIQNSLQFELEDDLPFSIDDTLYDYSVLSQSGQISHVHVAATLKAHAQNTLNHWTWAGLDPDLITTEAWAFRTLLNKILPTTVKEKPVLLLQIGAERTLLYIHFKSYPIYARELHWGGRDLTTAICLKYGIPLNQAETTKKDHGFILPLSQRKQASADQVEFSDALQEPLEEFLQEIRQTKLICKNIAHDHLSGIYLTGGTSLIPGLCSLMEEELQITTQPLKGLSTLAASGVTYSEHTDATFLLAASIALCMVGPERTTGINLRKGQLAKQSRGSEFSLKALRRPLQAIGALLSCFFLSQVVQNQIYQSHLKSIDAQLEKSIRTFFGQISNSAVRTYLSSPHSLQEAIKRESGKAKEIAKLSGPNPHSPIGFLKNLSTTLPQDAVVDLIQFGVGSAATAPYAPTEATTVELTFLVSNPQVTEKVTSLLNGKLTGLQRSSPEEILPPDGAAKRWKVTFSGKPTEDFYGK